MKNSSINEKVPQRSAFLPPATKLGQGNIFTDVCSQGGLPQCMLGYHPTPWTRHPPITRHPPGPGSPSGPGTPDQAGTPPSRAYWEIRSTSGWYAFYWNAILFTVASKPISRVTNSIAVATWRSNTLFNGRNYWLWFCLLSIVALIEFCQWKTRIFKCQSVGACKVKVSLSRCFPCFVCFPTAVLLACVCFVARNWGIPISCPALLWWE